MKEDNLEGPDTPESTSPGPKPQAPPEAPAQNAVQASSQSKAPPVKKPAKRGPTYEDLVGDPLADRLREHFPSALISAQAFLGQSIYLVALDSFVDVMVYLRESPQWSFDYLVDLTALDCQGDEKRFCMVYHLYSHRTGALIRVKCRVGEEEIVPSMTSIWETADWLEREAYDMFGIEFGGHPDLKRILLPDDWRGFPLRKDYDLRRQDQTWIQEHLRIREIPE
jgi:NADH-quinone oxidoreductase subunit C